MNENTGKGSLGFVGVLQLIFIVLKLCKVINWGWGLVLLPIEISIAVVIIFIIVMILFLRRR